ncbi:carbohydrate ABC transporter permease [Paenibacillus sp. MMS20-IR301]|uniref:carbohydrate ABC transporter permease n=1 Tax=Paenibacillus sp. MMS20-IR301 TaxID=2895946 RepID=UPI0028E988B1|nr:carbohydrate ABC transporter permease [Paenibacillus sp. MMS20-IR301]WNS43182.1 carbohydrate ABC transporter permease [Paenibacillus sp. MMS20-IR301]
MRMKLNNVWIHVFMIAASILMLYPVFWWVGASLKSPGEMGLPTIWPKQLIWDNYIDGWNYSANYSFATFFKNSLVMEFWNVLGAVISSSLVAFGFARIKFALSKFWFAVLLMTMMLPAQVTIIPQYILFNNFGFVNSYIPLIMPHILGGGAFFIFLVVQFIRGIPKELDEAATIDGTSVFGIYYRIILPLIVPALMNVAIFTFIWSWDDFLAQVLYLNTIDKYTVGLALRMFIDQFDIQWGQLLAMSLLSIMPSALIFLFAQRYFVDGIATTGIKG